MAVYGLSENGQEQVGINTITRKKLLEVVREQLEEWEFSEQEGTGSGSVDLCWQGMASVVRLTVTLTSRPDPAFLSEVCGAVAATEDFKEFRVACEDDTKALLASLATGHLERQAQKLQRQIRHEYQAMTAAGFPEGLGRNEIRHQACHNIWTRVMGGLHARHGKPEREPEWSLEVAECLLLYFLLNLGELLLHTPCYIDEIFKSVVIKAEEGQQFCCSLDYDRLRAPLKDFSSNSDVFARPCQGKNLDDIDDSGASLKKTFHEPIGASVLLTNLLNFQWALTIFLWLGMAAFIAEDAPWLVEWEGRSPQAGTWRVGAVTMLSMDVLWFMGLRLLDCLIAGPEAGRSSSCSASCTQKIMKGLGLLVGLLLFALLATWRLLRDTTLLASFKELAGMPLWRYLDKSTPWLPWAWFAARLLAGVAVKWREASVRALPTCFFLLFPLACFAANRMVLVPIARPLTPFQLCSFRNVSEDSCSRRAEGFPYYDSQCLACLSSVGIVWILALLCAVVLPVFLFDVTVALVGSVGGAVRGNARQARDLSKIDLCTEHDVLPENFDIMRQEVVAKMSHGQLLHAVYGHAWREVWRFIVAGLYEDCLINGAAREELLQLREVDMDKAGCEVLEAGRERLDFHFKSLRAILKDGGRIRFNPKSDALSRVKKGRVPSLTQIIPVYGETVSLGGKDLLTKAREGLEVTPLFAFLVSQFREEWRLFAEQEGMEAEGLLRLLQERPPEGSELMDRVCRWASHRHQTVSKTVDGALHYAEALCKFCRSGWSSRDDRSEEVQVIVTHQTYGQVVLDPVGTTVTVTADGHVRVRQEGEERAVAPGTWVHIRGAGLQGEGFYEVASTTTSGQELKLCSKVVWCGEGLARTDAVMRKVKQAQREKDVHKMMREHKDKPLYVAVDLHHDNSHPALKALVERDFGKTLLFKHASVLLEYRAPHGESKEWPVRAVSVIPRAHPLRCGSNRLNLSQGKAGNHRNALLFADGHFLQMLDANMGCDNGEACKVPVALWAFYRHPEAGAKQRWRWRTELQCSIIGFPEWIFTGSHGLVGMLNADVESTFGKTVQRSLGWLGVRMHYGHPDFIDNIWASTQGSVSKASPDINLSEDIFLGFAAKITNHRSEHVEFLRWQKGREVQFMASTGFFWKVASGNVGVQRSRDLWRLCAKANPLSSMTLYFATIGYYLHNLLVDVSSRIYVALFLVLTLGSKSVEDLGKLGTLLAVEWVVTPGLSAYLPSVFEALVERGPKWFLKNRLIYFPVSLPYFIFINKTVASSVETTIFCNKADYVKTGRPAACQPYSLKEAFQAFWTTHYFPAVAFLGTVVTYWATNTGGALPMSLIVMTALCWMLAPVLFKPPDHASLQPLASRFKRSSEELRDLWEFIFTVPSQHAEPSRSKALYGLILREELGRSSRPYVKELFLRIAGAALLVVVTPTVVWNHTRAPLLVWAISSTASEVIRSLGVESSAILLTMQVLTLLSVVPLKAVIGCEDQTLLPSGPLLLACLLFLFLCDTAKMLLWLAMDAFLLPCLRLMERPVERARVVRATFDYLCVFQFRVACAIGVFMAQAALEYLLAALDALPWRLRSRLLLNGAFGASVGRPDHEKGVSGAGRPPGSAAASV